MAGLGSRFSSAGYKKPKPFIDVNGKPMIERVLDNLSYPGAKYILIAKDEHLIYESKLVDRIKNKYNVEFVSTEILTEGTAATVLLARRHINNEEPLVIANSDQIVDIDFYRFVNECMGSDIDGSIMTFFDKEKDPKWSFALIDSQGYVKEVKEKIPISHHATVGIYMFNRGRFFVDSAIDMIVHNDRVNGEFYTCPVYNYMIQSGKKINIFEIDYKDMYGLGTPNDLEYFLKLDK